MNYAMLQDRLEAHSFKDTKASIAIKLKRETFATTLLFACLAALKVKSVAPAELAAR